MKVFWRAVTGLYLVLLTVMSLLPGGTQSGEDGLKQAVHNTLHFPAYAVLTYLFLQSVRDVTGRSYFWVAVIAIGYGVCMEFAQSYIPNRFMSFSDVLVNASGVLVTIILARKQVIKII